MEAEVSLRAGVPESAQVGDGQENRGCHGIWLRWGRGGFSPKCARILSAWEGRKRAILRGADNPRVLWWGRELSKRGQFWV